MKLETKLILYYQIYYRENNKWNVIFTKSKATVAVYRVMFELSKIEYYVLEELRYEY